MKFEKLGNITSNLDGKRIPLNSQQRAEKSIEKLYPYIGANNIMDYIDEYIFDEKILCLAEDGGSWGAKQICANIYNEKCWVNNHAHVLKENGKANLEYLRYFLNEADLNKHITGTTRGKLTKSALNSIEVPLPPLETQLHIANILTKAESLIAQRKESIRLLDEYLKSVFLEMFGDPVRNEKGWETRTIEELVINEKWAIKRGPFGGALKKEIFVEDGYLVYEQFHALNNDFSFARYYIDESKFQELKAFEVKSGDIIISCSGVYLGKLAIVPEGAKQGIINQALLKISLDNSKMDNKYFVFLFSHSSFKNEFFGSTRGSGIPNFPPMTEFKKFKFIYPPFELQTRFVQIVENTEALKAQYQQSLQELENLYGSLSQKAFKGELNLKDEGLLMAAEPETKYGV